MSQKYLHYICVIITPVGVSRGETPGVADIDVPSFTIGDGGIQNLTRARFQIVFSESRFPANTNRLVRYTSRRLAVQELRTIKRAIPIGASAIFSAEEGGWFDLWHIAEAMTAPPGTAVRADFVIKNPAGGPVYLGVGSFDDCFLYQDGITIYGSVGARDLSRCDNLIALRTFRGDSKITLICRKAHAWFEIPKQHYCSTWAFSLVASARAALLWRDHCNANFHLLDTPIVSDPAQIRINCFAHQAVSLMDERDEVVATGNVMEDGTVRWRRQINDACFEGLMEVRLQNGDSEMVLCTTQPLDRLLAVWAATETESKSLWTTRVSHLADAVPITDRDLWWSRKVTQAMAFKKYETTAEGAGVPSSNRALSLRTLRYESSVDGSFQYYQLFIPLHGPVKAVAVIMPMPPNPLRPPLESQRVANLFAQEQIAGIANAAGVAVITPLFVDADYGGSLAVAEISRILDNAIERDGRLRAKPAFAVGVCAGGLAAINAVAKDERFAGLVLYSPLIKRPFVKWLPSLPTDGVSDTRNPNMETEYERALPRLASVPILLVYDSGMIGHGDMSASRELVSDIEKRHGAINAVWLPLIYDYVWGERLNSRYDMWFEWIAKTCQSRSRVGAIARNNNGRRDGATTIKDAIIDGFTVQKTGDKELNAFRLSWFNMLKQYRGETPRSSPLLRTTVKFRVRNMESLEDEERLYEAEGDRRMVVNPDFWIFVKINSSVEKTIEIGRSKSTIGALPVVDPLVDGVFRAMFWKKIYDTWVLINLRVPDSEAEEI